MKDLKKKLTAAGAMLVVSAVMLSGVSYAWYTLSTNPEVSNIKANIAANENLEIALDNGYENEAAVNDASKVTGTSAQGSTKDNPYTWGNLVDLNVAMGTLNPKTGSTATPKLILAPVKYTSADTFNYPKYGLDGRVDNLNSTLTGVVVSDNTQSANGGVKGWKQSETSTTYDALSVTYWLRSNETCKVSLSTAATKRAKSTNDTQTGNTDVNTVTGNGSYIEIPVSGENTATIVGEYAKNLVVQLNVNEENPIYARLTNAKNVASTETEPAKVKFDLVLDKAKTKATTGAGSTTIDLTANEAKKVTM